MFKNSQNQSTQNNNAGGLSAQDLQEAQAVLLRTPKLGAQLFSAPQPPPRQIRDFWPQPASNNRK